MDFTTVPQLGRHSKVATFISGGGVSERLLLDAELEWMTEDRFELSGVSISFTSDGRDEAYFAGGWLCQYWAPDPEEPKRTKISLHTENWGEAAYEAGRDI